VKSSRFLLAGAVLALAACGGGGGGAKSSSDLALGTKAVVTHTQIASGNQKAATTTLGITVLKVRKGTQQELTQGGLTVDAKNKSDTPYYVDVRYENTGSAAIKRSLDVGLEDQDGNLITAVTIFNFGGKPFAKCPAINDGAGIQLRELHAFPRPEGQGAGQGQLPPVQPAEGDPVRLLEGRVEPPRRSNRFRTVRLPARPTVSGVRRLIVSGTLFAGFAVAAVAAASAPPVPVHSQQAIKQRTKLYAYVPARVPLGFRYYRWSFTPKPAALRIAFRNKAGWEIAFVASPQAGCAGAGNEKSFQLDGNKVYWSHTATEQQAWRCVVGPTAR